MFTCSGLCDWGFEVFTPYIKIFIVQEFQVYVFITFFLIFKILFLRNYWFSLLRQNLTQNLQICGGVFNLKVLVFAICIGNLKDRPKVTESANSVESSRDFNFFL